MAAIEVFFCYSSQDARLRQDLEVYLAPLKRDGTISAWHDGKIIPGDPWEDDIRAALERAQIVLPLISGHFLDSDYCVEKEMKRAMERHEAKQAKVIPILLSACDWEETQYAKLQVLPTRAKAVAKWGRRADAFTDIAKGLRKAISSFRSPSASPPTSAPSPSAPPKAVPPADTRNKRAPRTPRKRKAHATPVPSAPQPTPSAERAQEIVNSIGMRLRLIPAGSFKMGSTKGAADERPVETITLEKPFCLGVC